MSQMQKRNQAQGLGIFFLKWNKRLWNKLYSDSTSLQNPYLVVLFRLRGMCGAGRIRNVPQVAVESFIEVTLCPVL